jgi:hypothetical protein
MDLKKLTLAEVVLSNGNLIVERSRDGVTFWRMPENPLEKQNRISLFNIKE